MIASATTVRLAALDPTLMHWETAEAFDTTAETSEPYESDTMTLLISATHCRDHAAHERAINALASKAQVPIAQVAQLYARELAALTAGARITSFLTILTTRKVRELLRHGCYPMDTLARVDAQADDDAERSGRSSGSED